MSLLDKNGRAVQAGDRIRHPLTYLAEGVDEIEFVVAEIDAHSGHPLAARVDDDQAEWARGLLLNLIGVDFEIIGRIEQ